MHMKQVQKLWKMKLKTSSGILKTNPNGSYYKVFKLQANDSSYVEIGISLF